MRDDLLNYNAHQIVTEQAELLAQQYKKKVPESVRFKKSLSEVMEFIAAIK